MKKSVNLLAYFILFTSSFLVNAEFPEIISGPYYNDFTDYAYYILEPSSWLEAQKKAESMGGNLVTINTIEQNNWLRQLSSEQKVYIWIGLSDAQVEGVFNWVDGKNLTFSNWDAGEPSSYGSLGEEDYVHMYNENGFWNDIANDPSRWHKINGCVEIYSNRTLVCIEIIGPNDIAGQSSVQYKAVALFDNNTTKDITDQVNWKIEPANGCVINNTGLMTINQLAMPEQNLTLYINYQNDNHFFNAEKDIKIYDLCSQGYALEFDGLDDYVDIGDGFADFSNGLTLTLWAFPTSKNYWQRFIDLGNGGASDNIIFTRYMNSETLSLEIFHGNYLAGRINAKNAIELNKWQHFAVVLHSDGNAQIYKDGNLISSDKVAVPKNLIRYNNFIGKSNWHTDPYYSGIIDEVAIWNAPLSNYKIKKLMLLTPDLGEPNLMAYWDFNNSKNQVIYDLSGNGNDAYLGNDPYNVDIADPVWVMGRPSPCSDKAFVEKYLESALDKKITVLKLISQAIEQEYIAENALETYFDDRDFEGISKSNLVKAKQKIQQAIQNERVSELFFEKSIEKLEDSIKSLTVE